MGIIGHIAILAFAVIVAVVVGILVVIEMFGTVEYLTDKSPRLQKILERRSAPGVLVLVVILLLAGDAYELLIKEVPEVPVPKLEIKTPLAPEISKCEIRIVSQGGKTPPLQPCPPQTVASQPSAPARQGNPPQTQLERLTELNKNLPKGDRDRLADALFDYAKILDQAEALQARASLEGGQISNAWVNGSITKDFEAHKTKLHELDSSAREFSKSYAQAREKWKYYPNQTSYIFGDNPDNLGPNAIINAVDAFSIFFDRWSAVQNKERREVLYLFEPPQNQFNDSITRIFHWIQGCQIRLEEMRKSIQ